MAPARSNGSRRHGAGSRGARQLRARGQQGARGPLRATRAAGAGRGGRPRADRRAPAGTSGRTRARAGRRPRRRRRPRSRDRRRLDRALAQEVGAERVDGADAGQLELGQRGVEARLLLGRGLRRVRSRSISARRRSFISPAAFSVKVTATMPCSSPRPDWSRARMRPTSAVVLPVPAAASTTNVASRSSPMRSRAAASASGRRRHGCLRSSTRGSSRRRSLVCARCSSYGPHTVR